MKRLTVNHLAFSNLRARKKQYILMITGIVLAMIFSSGIIFFISCINTSLTELTYSGYGRQNMILAHVTDEDALKNGVKEGVYKEYGTAEILGYAYTEENESKGFSVARYDEKGLEISRQSIAEGRMPEKEGEIAIESDALTRIRVKAKVGDKLTFRFKIENDGSVLDKDIEKTYVLTGILKDKRRNIQEYSGFENPDALPAAVVSDKEQIEPGGKERICAYICYPKANGITGEYYTRILEYRDKYHFYDEDKVYYTEGRIYWNLGGGEIEEKGMLAGVLAAVLAVASCVGIINSFNTNLQDRKKQIGLLRSVGATRRQIISIFGREAFIIALVAAPVSVIVSYFATKGIIRLMGEKMIFAPKLWILFAGAVLSVIVVMAAALVPLFTASRTSPMQSIRNIDIIRKMKNRRIRIKKEFNVPNLIANRDIAFSKGKTVAVCFMLIASFMLGSIGISFLKLTYEEDSSQYYAYDYEVRCDVWGSASPYGNNARADGYGISGNMVNEILMNPYVESVSPVNRVLVTLVLNKQYKILETINLGDRFFVLSGKDFNPDLTLTEDNYVDFIKEQDKKEIEAYSDGDLSLTLKAKTEAQEKFGIGENHYCSELESRSEKEIKGLKNNVIEGRIDMDKINSGEEIILMLPEKIAQTYSVGTQYWEDRGDVTFVTLDSLYHFNPDGSPRNLLKNYSVIDVVENDIHAGDEMDLSVVFDKYLGSEGPNAAGDIFTPEAKQYRKTVRVGAVVTPPDEFGYNGMIITSGAGYATLGCPDAVVQLGVDLNCECTEEVEENLTAMLDTVTSGNNAIYQSTYEAKKDAENQMRTTVVTFVSVLILFFVVCASLINNSMNAKIREDKRQIGTLRAVGASAGELTKAYILRLLRIFGIGLTGGLTLYTAVHFGLYLYLKISEQLHNDGYMDYLVWPSILFTLLMFAVCAFNLWRQVGKQMKYSIVDNIREL